MTSRLALSIFGLLALLRFVPEAKAQRMNPPLLRIVRNDGFVPPSMRRGYSFTLRQNGAWEFVPVNHDKEHPNSSGRLDSRSMSVWRNVVAKLTPGVKKLGESDQAYFGISWNWAGKRGYVESPVGDQTALSLEKLIIEARKSQAGKTAAGKG